MKVFNRLCELNIRWEKTNAIIFRLFSLSASASRIGNKVRLVERGVAWGKSGPLMKYARFISESRIPHCVGGVVVEDTIWLGAREFRFRWWINGDRLN